MVRPCLIEAQRMMQRKCNLHLSPSLLQVSPKSVCNLIYIKNLVKSKRNKQKMSRKRIGSLSESLGTPWKPSKAVLGAIWKPVGPLGSLLGDSRDTFGALQSLLMLILEPRMALLGLLGSLLDAFWSLLGTSWEHLGRESGVQGPSSRL